jgi:protein-tyrosine phosphatase
MIDIHSHVLPAVDDGARTLAEAVEMMRMAAAAGTTDIVATPHANLKFAFNAAVVAAAIEELRQASGGAPHLHRGCDFHLTMENIQQALANPAQYAINGRRYLLIELSELGIPRMVEEIFGRLQAVGFILVLTHPERNPLLQERLEQMESWVELGVLMQVTGQSLLGRFGGSAKRVADRLLERGLVHFVASDAHDPLRRPPLLDEARRYVAKHHGRERAEALFVTNPRAALEGEPLDTGAAGAPRRKKWYQF